MVKDSSPHNDPHVSRPSDGEAGAMSRTQQKKTSFLTGSRVSLALARDTDDRCRDQWALAGPGRAHYHPGKTPVHIPEKWAPVFPKRICATLNGIREEPMSDQAAVARTPGAKRAGPGEYLFDPA